MYRTQHDELLEIANDIAQHLSTAALAQDASTARALLSKLLGRLKVHLSMEDKSLYPRLMAHPDPRISGVAKKFMDEMGGIVDVVTAYSEKWSTERKIQANADAFVLETQGLFSALANRIDKENNELYPLVDAYH